MDHLVKAKKVEFQQRWSRSSRSLCVNDLWTDGILCAYEFNENAGEWAAIGWDRIVQIVETLQDQVLWWCNFSSGHLNVNLWLDQWLPSAASIPLRLASESPHENLDFHSYAHPIRLSEGLLFELHGHAARNPCREEEDMHLMLRCWQFGNMLITVQHVLTIQPIEPVPLILGMADIQDVLCGHRDYLPKTVHEVIAQLTFEICEWDYRLFTNSVFCKADEIEIKFVNRRHNDDLNLTGMILNEEIRKLSVEIIRVKWYLHAREKVICDLLGYLRGDFSRRMLESVRKSTREMLENQEAVRGRLFILQDVMQSTARALVQEKSLRVTHNLTILGSCAVILSIIITGLFGVNLDGIPGSSTSPYAFTIFRVVLLVLGLFICGLGLYYFKLEKPISEAEVKYRKMERKLKYRKMEINELVCNFH